LIKGRVRDMAISAPRIAICAAIALVWGCVPTLPSQPVERALVRDVGRVVDVRQKVGWVIDDLEVEAILPDVLRSACQVDEPDRKSVV
jgi:hypothetical protein